MGSMKSSKDDTYAIELTIGREIVTIDAGGGIDSGFPLHFGLRFINDPLDPCDEGNETTVLQKQKKLNIEVEPNGMAYTTNLVPMHTEFLMRYDRKPKKPKKATSP
jgi:hypothetical protein